MLTQEVKTIELKILVGSKQFIVAGAIHIYYCIILFFINLSYWYPSHVVSLSCYIHINVSLIMAVLSVARKTFDNG